MIKEVIQGEKLTAKTQNEIIQACNGLMQPAGSYVNTPNGSLYPNAAPGFNNMLGRCVETMFQLKFELKQHLSKRTVNEQTQHLSDEYSLSSIWYGYSINLGNDYAQLKDQVRLMQPDNDDIFIVGGLGINGSGDTENGDTLSVHLAGTPTIIDGSDKEGFFDLGVYWKSPTNGCPGIEVQKMQLSTDNQQEGPTKNAFVIRGKNYSSQDAVKEWYRETYGGNWRVLDTTTTTIGYVYDQKLVQCRTGILFPEVVQEWVDSQIDALELSSVQEKTYGDYTYHQMFNFDQRELSDFQISDDCDIVLRDYTRTRVPAGAAVNYVKLNDFLSAISVDVDTWATQGGQRSIDWNTTNNKKYLQLYNFNSNSYDDALKVSLVYGQHRYATKDGSGEYPDPYVEFVVRDRSGARMVKYDALDIYAPPIYASDVTDLCTVISGIVEHECSCDLGPLSAALEALSAQLSNYWKVGGDYQDNCYGQSIGDSSSNLALDLDNGGMWYESSQTVDWHACELYDYNGQDGPGVLALNWAARYAFDTNSNLAIDWDGRSLRDSSQYTAIDWENRTLYDSNNHIVADWERKQLLDNNTILAVNWADRRLDDSNQNVTLNWQDRMLEGDWAVNGNLSVEQGATLTIGNTSLTEAQLQALLALINGVPQALQGI